MSLQAARKAAFRLTDEPQPQNASSGLSASVRAYLEDCETKNRASTIKEYRRMLALIPDKPLSEVTRKDLKNPTSHQITCWRIFFNPRRIRPLTVPRGTPIRSAISWWVRPLKNASVIASRCSSGRVLIAA